MSPDDGEDELTHMGQNLSTMNEFVDDYEGNSDGECASTWAADIESIPSLTHS